MHDVEFVSQRGEYAADLGCGVAATMMLLRHHAVPRRPSYRRLCDLLRVEATAQEKYPHYRGQHCAGVFVEDVARYLDRRGWPFEVTVRKTAAALRRLPAMLARGPVMVGVHENPRRWSAYGHWIVLVGARPGRYVYLDPGYVRPQNAQRELATRAFAREWDGTSIQIAKFGRRTRTM